MMSKRGCVDLDPSDEAGFTVVELLVALALFSLLVTLLFNDVGFGLRAWQIGSSHAERFERSIASQDILRRMIGSTYPMLVRDGAGAWVDFEGAKETLKFLADAPMVAGGAGRFRFKLFVERHEDRSDLMMSSAPELANLEDSSMTSKTPLLPDIDRVQFSYSGSVAAAQGTSWRDSWIKRSDLPRLVRVRVVFPSGDTRLWPDLLVSPHIAADVGCVYDSITKRCQGR
jgi:general secretion pathway protein J